MEKTTCLCLVIFISWCWFVNPNTFVGLVGKVQKKNYLPKEEGREGGEKSAPAGPGARTRDLPRARRGSPAAATGVV